MAGASAGFGSSSPLNRTFDEDSLTTAVRATLNGEAWTVSRISNNLGETCYQLAAPTGKVRSCLPLSHDLAHQGVAVETIGTPATSVVVGFAAPRVERVELVRADCSVQRLPLSNGMFFTVRASSGAAPHKVVAFDGQGSRLTASRLTDRGVATSSSRAC